MLQCQCKGAHSFLSCFRTRSVDAFPKRKKKGGVRRNTDASCKCYVASSLATAVPLLLPGVLPDRDVLRTAVSAFGRVFA